MFTFIKSHPNKIRLLQSETNQYCTHQTGLLWLRSCRTTVVHLSCLALLLFQLYLGKNCLFLYSWNAADFVVPQFTILYDKSRRNSQMALTDIVFNQHFFVFFCFFYTLPNYLKTHTICHWMRRRCHALAVSEWWPPLSKLWFKFHFMLPRLREPQQQVCLKTPTQSMFQSPIALKLPCLCSISCLQVNKKSTTFQRFVLHNTLSSLFSVCSSLSSEVKSAWSGKHNKTGEKKIIPLKKGHLKPCCYYMNKSNPHRQKLQHFKNCRKFQACCNVGIKQDRAVTNS